MVWNLIIKIKIMKKMMKTCQKLTLAVIKLLTYKKIIIKSKSMIRQIIQKNNIKTKQRIRKMLINF